MLIKKLQATDSLALRDLELKYFEKIWSLEQTNIFLQDSNNYSVGIFNQRNILIGFLQTQKIFDEVEIILLVVQENYRRRGLAGEIFEFVENFYVSGGIKTFFLEVRESNQAAIKFYTKCEFKKIGIRKHYYSSPTENALLMAKQI